MITPPFDDLFATSVGVLYTAATRMDHITQRDVFLSFLNTYGTHYFTEMLFGAKIAVTQKYSASVTEKVGRETLTKCTTKKTSRFFGFFKKQSTSCSSSDEQTIERYNDKKFEAMVT